MRVRSNKINKAKNSLLPLGLLSLIFLKKEMNFFGISIRNFFLGVRIPLLECARSLQYKLLIIK